MLNWVKIRVWEQVQWDGIIMIDVDVTVLGDLTHLFHLPTDFAAVPDNGKVWNRYALDFPCTSCRQSMSAVICIAGLCALSGAAAAYMLCLYHLKM